MEFWTVIAFYEGGNWLAWTYATQEQALIRWQAEARYPGSQVRGIYIPREVDLP
jgi:hypothetical protein